VPERNKKEKPLDKFKLYGKIKDGRRRTRMNGKGKNITRLAMPHILSFLQEFDTAAVSEIKEYVEMKVESPINDNTFYNILYKMKQNNWIESLEDRGFYRLTEAGRDKLGDYEKRENLKRDLHGEEDDRSLSGELLSAEEFVRKNVNKLRLDVGKDFLGKNARPYDPWSVTPKLAECIASLKVIVDNFEKIDKILAEVDKEKKKGDM